MVFHPFTLFLGFVSPARPLRGLATAGDGRTGAFEGTRPPTALHQAAEFVGFARGEDDDALGIFDQGG